MTDIVFKEPNRISREKCKLLKPSLFFAVMLIALIMAFRNEYYDILSLKYAQTFEGDIWRIVSSPIASSDLTALILNIISLVLMTAVCERRKGSVAHCIDFLLKVVLINSMSILLYMAIKAGATIYPGLFEFILQIQDKFLLSGIHFYLISEIFILLSNPKFNEELEDHLKFSNALISVTVLYFVLMSCYSYQQIGLVASVFIALCFRLCGNTYTKWQKGSRLISSLENCLRPLHPLLYVSHRAKDEIKFYESCEISSIQSHKDSQISTQSSPATISEYESGITEKVDGLRKSRYDDVNMQDYIFNAKSENLDHNQDESFEI
jgi:hypothetical protein